MRNISYSAYQVTLKGGNTRSRIIILIGVACSAFLIIAVRLFQLQVLHHAQYSAIAQEQHFGAISLPARRGEIYVKDTHSGELSKLATNTTLDLLYIDPMVATDKQEVATKLTPLIFPQSEYQQCLQKPEDCFYNVKKDTKVENVLVDNTIWDIQSGTVKDVERVVDNNIDFKPYEEMTKEISEDILQKISKSEVDFVVLKRGATDELMSDLVNERLTGIFVDKERQLVYGDPTMIPDGQLPAVARTLATYLSEPPSQLETQLTRRQVRYVFIKNKISPETSDAIDALKLKGVVLLPEHWRYYPEGQLASNIVGFINRDDAGQYGVEGYYNSELEGKKGTIYAESDPFGRQITVGDTKIVNAVDGDTIVLTIDRVVQQKVEEILKDKVQEYRADSGQVLIMNPFTGAILAMANYPSFDPNDYTAAYELRKLDKGEKVEKTIPVFKKDDKGQYIAVTDADLTDETIDKYVYKNKFGPGVFKNKVVSEYYEPGSVFKPIVMSVGLDTKEVEPQTTYDNNGPLTIDDFTIKNSTGIYGGITTMTEVLEKSLNTGMAWVAKKLGKKLVYEYLKDFGFGQYTNIELEGEAKGELDYYTHWSKAQLLTTGFGQGIVVTPLQMVAAWSALANGGKLMQPYIVDSVIRNGEVVKTEPQVIHRVISEETSSIISSMLVSVVKNYHGRADIPGYMVAGKTGTAQIAGKNGQYEKGDGSTITSFIGYFPVNNPQFVVLVKLDRPRIGEGTWGETTAAPTFQEIGKFLVDYFNIPPSS